MRDNDLIMSDNVAVLSTAASSSVDTRAANSNIGQGTPINAAAMVTVTYDAGATVLADLQDSADDAAFANILVGIASAANPAAGTILFDAAVPGNASRQYLRMNYTITGTPTVGSISAYLDIHHLAKK